jgi:hypothetical protein
MAQLIVRHLEDDLKTRLKRRTVGYRRSTGQYPGPKASVSRPRAGLDQP